ncbi:MAG TPA: helix-turn-helix domain-containing protein [Firmicutes bacterium]|nr:helix-turn-helix domain-containing protein [Bacillota bacterium]
MEGSPKRTNGGLIAAILAAAVLVTGGLVYLAQNLPLQSYPSSLDVWLANAGAEGDGNVENPKAFLTLDEAAAYIGIDSYTLSQWAAEGRIDGCFLRLSNGTLLFSKDELKAAIEALMAAGADFS